jgi:hypothetical protein
MTWRDRLTGHLVGLRDGMRDGTYFPSMSGAALLLDEDPAELEAGIAEAADALRVQIGGDCGASVGVQTPLRQAHYALFCDGDWLEETRALFDKLVAMLNKTFGALGEPGQAEVLRAYRDELETMEEQTAAIAPPPGSWWENSPTWIKWAAVLGALWVASDVASKWR